MAVNWTSTQAKNVEQLLLAHPVESGRCAVLAREVLPIATVHDADAHGLLITPRPDHGWFVEPKVGGRFWTHHALVGVAQHGVDALTGSPGTPIGSYLEQHWNYLDSLVMTRTELEEPWL